MTDKILRTNTIEKLKLDDRIEEMYFDGKSAVKITDILQGEGYNLDVMQVRNHIRTRIKPGIEKKRELKKERSNLLNGEDVNPELKLLDAIKESYDNYLECSKDAKRAKEASDWFNHYKDLLEKHLRATGTYERAKNEAKEDNDKLIEVVWIYRYICDKCGEIVDEVPLHNVTNLSDKQTEVEKQKEEIENSLAKESQ